MAERLANNQSCGADKARFRSYPEQNDSDVLHEFCNVFTWSGKWAVFWKFHKRKITTAPFEETH